MSQDTINRLLVRGAQARPAAGPAEGRRSRTSSAAAAKRPWPSPRRASPSRWCPASRSAIAAPALAGIPVTHRGLASGVLVVSGHAESSYAPAIDSLAPKGTTLVVLMGVNTRAQIAGRLVARGWSDATPVALLFAASTPDARTWIGTLGDLVAGAPLQLPETPGTLVVGDVVSLAAALAPDSGALQVTDAADDEPAASNE